MSKKSDNIPHIIELQKIRDKRGNLSIVEAERDIPFAIARTYWIYDVPGGESRGAHAYRESKELIIALSGSFTVCTNDGKEERSFSLNNCSRGVYVPQGVWRRITHFATNSVALVISSTRYNPRDYIRDFDKYIELKNSGEL